VHFARGFLQQLAGRKGAIEQRVVRLASELDKTLTNALVKTLALALDAIHARRTPTQPHTRHPYGQIKYQNQVWLNPLRRTFAEHP
jgi:hypothetical protein